MKHHFTEHEPTGPRLGVSCKDCTTKEVPMKTLIDASVIDKADVSAADTRLMIGTVTFHFDGPAQPMVNVLDRIAAGALEIRGRLLRELTTDEDA